MLLAAHLSRLGQVSSLIAAQYVTMLFVRERREFACYHRELGNYLSRAKRQILEDERRWLEAC
jgi:hypothetical protein